MTTDKLTPGHTCVDRPHVPCEACDWQPTDRVAMRVMWLLFAAAFLGLAWEVLTAGPDRGFPQGFTRMFAMTCLIITAACFLKIRRIIRIELLGLGWHKPGEFTGDHSINQIYKDGGAA